MGASVEPILHEHDVVAASRFLRDGMRSRLGVDDWSRAIRTSFEDSAPYHGLMLRDGAEILAVLLTFFSRRIVGESQESFCNLGAWCARPDQRFQGLRLLRTVLRLPGYHFTDLSPSGSVVPLNERLGFEHLDTSSSLLPCLPLPSRGTVVTDPEHIASSLAPGDLTIFRDHQHAAAAHHALLRDADGECYVLYRLDRRKDLRVFASVLYVSDAETFGRTARALAGHLLVRQGTLALILEHRITGRPPGTVPLRTPRPKMYRSPTLLPEDVDNLYSELCAVPW